MHTNVVSQVELSHLPNAGRSVGWFLFVESVAALSLVPSSPAYTRSRLRACPDASPRLRAQHRPDEGVGGRSSPAALRDHRRDGGDCPSPSATPLSVGGTQTTAGCSEMWPSLPDRDAEIVRRALGHRYPGKPEDPVPRPTSIVQSSSGRPGSRRVTCRTRVRPQKTGDPDDRHSAVRARRPRRRASGGYACAALRARIRWAVRRLLLKKASGAGDVSTSGVHPDPRRSCTPPRSPRPLVRRVRSRTRHSRGRRPWRRSRHTGLRWSPVRFVQGDGRLVASRGHHRSSRAGASSLRTRSSRGRGHEVRRGNVVLDTDPDPRTCPAWTRGCRG